MLFEYSPATLSKKLRYLGEKRYIKNRDASQVHFWPYEASLLAQDVAIRN
ncbi:hypothetical protein gpAD87_29180 [Paenibacillus sp. AD87]|nr:hypothetical protein gpAD87_29180 [Paenibacillus sp. AD87]